MPLLGADAIQPMERVQQRALQAVLLRCHQLYIFLSGMAAMARARCSCSCSFPHTKSRAVCAAWAWDSIRCPVHEALYVLMYLQKMRPSKLHPARIIVASPDRLIPEPSLFVSSCSHSAPTGNTRKPNSSLANRIMVSSHIHHQRQAGSFKFH